MESIAVSESLLTDIGLDKLANYNTLFVGFSGGLDSTVLLHRLASESTLVGKLQAVHVHHGLSVNAGAWQSHCQRFCEALGVPLVVRQVDITGHANIDECARLARYQVFTSLLTANDGLLLAHHEDDQAETLLLQLFRGAGIDGLAAMLDVNVLPKGELVRPFLQYSRQTLEAYANQQKLTWITDESNQNIAFSRNFLRQKIIPLLQEKWPAVSTNLARTALHCQRAKSNLEALAKKDCIELRDGAQDSLEMSTLTRLSHPRLANVLRLWLQNNDIRLPSDTILNRVIHEVVLARLDATPMVQWGGTAVRRYQQRLYLLKNEMTPRFDRIDWSEFPAALQLEPGAKEGLYLQAIPAVQGLHVPIDRHVQVRFRQGGELFSWRGQTKRLKKLFQEWQVPPWQRDLIPLLYIDNDLAAVVGHAIGDPFYSTNADHTYHIEINTFRSLKKGDLFSKGGSLE